MRVTIERATKKGWIFTHSFIRVTVLFTEAEKEVIRRADLGEQMVYEHPQDKPDYEEWQRAREKRLREGQGAGGYLGGTRNFPRYRQSKMLHHFIENPVQDIRPYKFDDLSFLSIERAVEENLRHLKAAISSIEQGIIQVEQTGGKKTLEL